MHHSAIPNPSQWAPPGPQAQLHPTAAGQAIFKTSSSITHLIAADFAAKKSLWEKETAKSKAQQNSARIAIEIYPNLKVLIMLQSTITSLYPILV